MLGMFTFMACEKDDVENLSKEKAEAQISTAENEFIAKANEIILTDGYKIQEYIFTQLSLPFGSKSLVMGKGIPTVDQRVMEIAKQNLMQRQPEVNFYFDRFLLYYFNDVTGTWTWNPNTQSFTRTSTPTDKVVVKFPYPMGNSSNNVTLTYYDFTSSGGNITGLKVKIEKDGNQVFSLVVSATYTSTGGNVNLNVSFGQFTITVSESYSTTMNNNNISISLTKDFVVKVGGKEFYREEANARVTGSDQNNLNFVLDAKMIVANLEFRIKIEGNPNEFETANPNSFSKISLYTTRGDKVGDFTFVQENADWVLYFKFNNGEQVKAQNLMPALSEILESFILGIFDSFGK